jgi:hypothetical protein
LRKLNQSKMQKDTTSVTFSNLWQSIKGKGN